jgi:hypothetical protein
VWCCIHAANVTTHFMPSDGATHPVHGIVSTGSQRSGCQLLLLLLLLRFYHCCHLLHSSGGFAVCN